MSSYSSVSDLIDEEELLQQIEADSFHKVSEKTDEEIIKWLRKVKNALIDQGKRRATRQQRNYAAYLGSDTRRMDRSKFNDDNTRKLNRMNRLVINHVHDLTELKVSQMTRIKPSVQILPTNDEWSDRASATVTKSIIDHLWYMNNLDFMFQQVHRGARIAGEWFLNIDWDEDAGDIHPKYKAATDKGIKSIEVDGEQVSLKRPIMTGDVKYDIIPSWRILMQRALCMEDAEYYFRIHIKQTDKLKDKYPDKKDKIKASDNLSVFDINSGENRFVEKQTLVFEFIHKKTADLPEGRKILFTEDTILEEGPHDFLHGGFKFVRLTDLDVPDVLNGVSKYRFILPMQNTYNNLTTLIAKNIYLMAHAKWVMPRGAAKIESLGNDNTIVQFQGPVAPQMVQTNPNPQEVYNFRALLKEEMQAIYGSHGVSRGQIPKGITAASALQFLNELENERATTDIAKHNFLVRDVAKLTLAVIGEKYEVDDERILRIVGENNKYLIRGFDAAHLSKDYDVRVENSTGLPETKSSKIQRTLDALQRFPQMLPPERWVDILELGEDRKAISLIAEATRSADSENEDLLAGRPVADPEDYEDLIQHWQSHLSRMQERTFKEDVPPDIQDTFKDHVFGTEVLMMHKASTNPEFEAQLATLKLFPIFDHTDSPVNFIPQSREQAAAIAQGQANQGLEPTASIPGEINEDTTKQAENSK